MTKTTTPTHNYSNVCITGTSLTVADTHNTAVSTSINTGRVRITDQDIEFDGVGLRHTLQKMQEHLAILVPNPRLEAEWQELQDLAQRYRDLEIELLEKSRVWDTLKNTDK